MASGQVDALLRLDFCGIDSGRIWNGLSAGGYDLCRILNISKNYFKEYTFYDDTGAASGGCIGKNSEFNGCE